MIHDKITNNNINNNNNKAKNSSNTEGFIDNID